MNFFSFNFEVNPQELMKVSDLERGGAITIEERNDIYSQIKALTFDASNPIMTGMGDEELSKAHEQLEKIYNSKQYILNINELIIYKVTSQNLNECHFFDGVYIPFRIYLNVNGSTESVDIYYTSKKRSSAVLRKVKMSELYAKNILSCFQAKGITIEERNAKAVSEYLQRLILECSNNKYVKKCVCFDKVGFVDGNTDVFYCHTNIKGGDNAVLVGPMAKYVRQSGNDEVYIDMLKREVQRPETQLGLVIGFTGPIASRLKDHIDLGTLICSFTGLSTTGKSTMAMLATSPFACPVASNDGIIRRANGTDLSLIESLGNNHGITMVLDDLTAFKSMKDTENLIYALESGESKTHMNKDYSFGVTSSWRGTIIITGEGKLSNSFGKAGALVRILEFDSIKWTADANNSETIKKVVSENFGLIGPKFMRYYMRNYDMDLTLSAFKRACNRISQRITKKDKFSDRVINKCAVIYLTAEILNDYLSNAYGFSLNLEGILQLIIDAEHRNYEERNAYGSLYDDIKAFITSNMGKFVQCQDGKVIHRCNNPIGKIDNNFGEKIAYITSIGMKYLCLKIGIPSIPKRVLADFKEQGLLIVEETNDGHKYNCRTSINGIQCRTTGFILTDDESE